MRRAWPVALMAFSCASLAQEPATQAPLDPPPPPQVADPAPPAPMETGAGAPATAALPEGMRSGAEIFHAFRDGLAEPDCSGGGTRWQRHFAHAPARLADPGSDVLPLFGHVVDALREAHLPTEYALIPFVESGYAPGARSPSGPAGLWQFIAQTARHQGVRMAKGYDGRLSPAESTRAAVQYLRKLNGMLGGNWRLTAMAYNAGESRVLQALRRSGAPALEASPGALDGLSPITYAYVDKLHALACVLTRAGEDAEWLQQLERPVLALEPRPLEGAGSLEAWAAGNGQDAAILRRLKPALGQRWAGAPLALVPAITPPQPVALAAVRAVAAEPSVVDADTTSASRLHTVRQGESAWSIARRYGVAVRRLLEVNGLSAQSVLRPGMQLRVE